jgi:hypothetical protein
MNLSVGDNKVIAQGIETSMPAGINDFGSSTWAFTFTPGNYFWLGTKRKPTELSAALWATAGGFGFQDARTPTTTEIVLQPVANSTTVFEPSIEAEACK